MIRIAAMVLSYVIWGAVVVAVDSSMDLGHLLKALYWLVNPPMLVVIGCADLYAHGRSGIETPAYDSQTGIGRPYTR
jgi:hypothetical protein